MLRGASPGVERGLMCDIAQLSSSSSTGGLRDTVCGGPRGKELAEAFGGDWWWFPQFAIGVDILLFLSRRSDSAT